MTRTNKKQSRKKQSRQRKYLKRIAAEVLEMRKLLTTFTWDGGAGTQNWLDGANWDQGVALPGPADDVVIGAAAGTVDYNGPGDTTVQRIVSDANLRILGGRLVATGIAPADEAISSTASVTIDGGTLELGKPIVATGGLTLDSGQLTTTVDDILGTGLVGGPTSFTANGGTILTGGSGPRTISADFTINNTVTVGGPQSLWLEGVVSGTGGFTHATVGSVLTLFNANTYTGNDLVTGRVVLADGAGTSGTLGSVAGTTTVQTNGLLQVADTVNNVEDVTLAGTNASLTSETNGIQSGDVILSATDFARIFGRDGNTLTVSGQITGTVAGDGELILGDPTIGGTVVLSSNNTYNADTVLVGGAAASTLELNAANAIPDTSAVSMSNATLRLTAANESVGSLASSTGDTTVDLGAFDLTVGIDNSNTTYDGTITGTGGLNKNGSGTFTLTGASDFTGTTMINAGTLVVDGSLDSVVVIDVGTLSGSGTITSSVNVATGTVLAPGSSPGILTVDTVNFDDNSTFEVEIGGTTAGSLDTNHDQLNVTGAIGSVTIGNNVTLDTIQFNGFEPGVGDEFTIIENAGDAVVGTFDGLPEAGIITDFLGSGRRAEITYAGNGANDVVLSVFGQTVTWDGGAGTLEWNDALNWDGDTLPGPDDDVIIPDQVSSLAITHSSGSTEIQTLTLLGDESLTISGGSSLRVKQESSVGGNLRIEDATLTLDAELTVGSFEQTSDGTLELLFDLPAVTPFGKLTSLGNAELDGTLEIAAPGSGILAAVVGQTSDVLSFASSSGSFDEINGLFGQPLSGGGTVDLTATFYPDQLRLMVVPPAVEEVLFSEMNPVGTVGALIQPWQIDVDSSDNVILSGDHLSDTDFDLLGISPTVLTTGGRTQFVAKYDSNNEIQWAGNLQGANGLAIGSSQASGVAIVGDSDAVYLAGGFGETIDFDPGPGVVNRSSLPNDFDIYVSKWNSDGTLAWAYTPTRVPPAVPTAGAFAMDLVARPSGGVYVVGVFEGTVDFDPGPGVLQLSSSTPSTFLLDIDGNGNPVSVVRLFDSAETFPFWDIAVDSQGDILISGQFSGTVDFEPGAGVTERTSNGGTDAFVAQVDAGGNLQWVQSFGGAGTDAASAISVGLNDDVYVGGSFDSTTVDFDAGGAGEVRSVVGDFDGYLLSLNTSGDFNWVRTYQGAGRDEVWDVHVDSRDQVYAAGRFFGDVQFDEVEGTSRLRSSDPIGSGFYSRLDPAGNTDFAVEIDGRGQTRSYTIATNQEDEVLVAGALDMQADWGAFLLRAEQQHLLVYNTNDSGPGSLRQAILDANADPDTSYIEFNIPGAGPHTITLTSGELTITESVIIDGTSEPDFAGAPVIEVTTALTPAINQGIVINADNSVVQGLVVNEVFGDAVVISGDNNVVRGNYIGTNVTGDASAGNLGIGVHITGGGSNNLVGGSTPSDRNVISGNGGTGVRIFTGSTGNHVAGNYIGTDVTGTVDLGNLGVGVSITDGSGNIVGTDGDGVGDAGEGNVISGNEESGVRFGGNSMVNTVIAGNIIGLGADGTTPLGNTDDGIRIVANTGANRIGTNGDGVSDELERNIISANNRQGIEIFGPANSGTRISGNYIGTDVTGTLDRGNATAGIATSIGADGIVIGTNGDLSGDDIEGNLISGNLRGVVLEESTNVVVRGNLIGTDVTGTSALGNSTTGVAIVGGTGHTIGGVSDDERNVISGNGDGLDVFRSNAVTISGNYVGTSADGLSAIANSDDGIVVSYSAATIQDNVVSGNTDDGIVIDNSPAPDRFYTLWRAEDTTEAVGLGPGTFSGGAGYTFGVSGRAFQFDGIDGLLDTGLGGNVTENDLGVTIEGWVRSTDTAATIFADGGFEDTSTGIGLFIESGRLVFRGSKGTATEFNFEAIEPAPSLNDGNYHHVAATWTGETTIDGVKLYVDGVEVVSDTALLDTGLSPNGLAFGGHPTLAGYPFLDGEMDEFAIYSRPLDPAEILEIFNIGGRHKTSGGSSLESNFIGVDPSGSFSIGNGDDGLRIVNSANNSIGGFATENVIGGNSGDGIEIWNELGSVNLSYDNQIAANFIGTDVTGIADLGNTSAGVRLAGGNNVVSSNNTISGATIAFNGDGVVVSEFGDSNSITSNSIYQNVGLGIDLNGDGPTPNDPDLDDDADEGGNRLQNFPDFGTDIVLNGDNLDVTYYVDSDAISSTYPIDVDFFLSDGGQGREFLFDDEFSVADFTGNSLANQLQISVPRGTVGPGDRLVATATDAEGTRLSFLPRLRFRLLLISKSRTRSTREPVRFDRRFSTRMQTLATT